MAARKSIEPKNFEMKGLQSIESKSHALSKPASTLQFESSPNTNSSDVQWNINNLSFGYYNDNRTSHRSLLSLHAKSVPSKWEDAEKWLVSLSSSDRYSHNNLKHSELHSHLSVHSSKETRGVMHFEKQGSLRTVESSDSAENLFNKRVVCENATYQNDEGTAKMKSKHSVFQAIQNPLNRVNRHVDGCPEEKVLNKQSSNRKDDTTGADSDPHLYCQRSSANYRNRGLGKKKCLIYPPKPSSNPRSPGMADKGTEITPIASEEPSRNVTPFKERKFHSSVTLGETEAEELELGSSFGTTYSGEDLKKFSEADIALLNSQLDDLNFGIWTSRKGVHDPSKPLGRVSHQERKKNVWLTQAAAWEEAERARYMARYKQNELKIAAWENLQKAKAESEMRSIEIKAERMKLKAQEKLLNKLAALQRKSEEKRTAAQARKGERVAKARQQAECIRSTGRLSSSFFRIPFCR